MSLQGYSNLCQVGEGTYGYVYRAWHAEHGSVALKRLILHKQSGGFPLNTIREIKFLRECRHRSIVKLIDIVSSKGVEHLEPAITTDSSLKPPTAEKRDDETREALDLLLRTQCGSLYLVFEYIQHDLGGLLDARYRFSPVEIKSIVKQLFDALAYLHDMNILHRDIKSSNLLLTNHHQLKLADFGLARSYANPIDPLHQLGLPQQSSEFALTNNVVTMWYRPPELLLGATSYGPGVDVWSAGCVMGELELGRPLFPGKTEVEQLDLIARILGVPMVDDWPGLTSLPNHEMVAALPSNGSSLRQTYSKKLSDQSLALLERILVYDPNKRISPKMILCNTYFSSAPVPPDDPAELPPLDIAAGASFHEYQTKILRRQEATRRERKEEGDESALPDAKRVKDTEN